MQITYLLHDVETVYVTEGESDFMEVRLTWEQIQKKYPNQWVGLTEVKYMDDDGISVESAVVKYTDKTKGELTRMVLKGEIVSRHTNPEGHMQLGAVGKS